MEIIVVRPGDTLTQLARRYQVSPQELAEWNQLREPDRLAVGQALLIPGRDRVHTVRRGESLYSIAKQYGVGLDRLIAANPQIRDPARIVPGQRITVPFTETLGREIVVNGYVTAATESTLRETLPWLTFLSPFSWRTDRRGMLTRTYSFSAGGFRTAQLLTVTNLLPQGGFSSDIAHAILTEETAQNTFLGNVETQLALGGYYGVNLDFEYIYPFDRESYNGFLRRLAERLHSLGYSLVTAVAPKTSDDMAGLLYAAHDYAVHGTVADSVILMTYEWGYMYGPAMPVAPLPQVRKVLDYAVSRIPAGKLLMGIPNYGYDWTLPYVPGRAATVVTNTRAPALAWEKGASIHYDDAAQSPFFRYREGDGAAHEVWFEDARSLEAKLRLVAEYGLGGVSFWNLNVLFRTNFLVLSSLYGVEKVL